MNRRTDLWVKLKESLTCEDYDLIHALSLSCSGEEKIILKLELDYKLADAATGSDKTGLREINEFMCFDDKKLIGYVGICSFGGADSPLELSGMVHPEYRRQGIFSKLYELVIAECRCRNAKDILLLCDQKSVSGQKFLERAGAAYQYSEFEMYQSGEPCKTEIEQLRGIHLRKAVNADAIEVARQNAIYFGGAEEQVDVDATDKIPLPEDEERRGMTIYLAEKEEQILGKVHLQIIDGIGGIYGLGVLPQYRGKGFGRAILLEAIENLKALKAKEIMLQVATGNVSALSLYKSCGFEVTSVMDYFSMKKKKRVDYD